MFCLCSVCVYGVLDGNAPTQLNVMPAKIVLSEILNLHENISGKLFFHNFY